jgi:hypothetical protein
VDHVAEEVMQFNAQFAHEVREIGVTFTLDELNQRLQALRRRYASRSPSCHSE